MDSSDEEIDLGVIAKETDLGVIAETLYERAMKKFPFDQRRIEFYEQRVAKFSGSNGEQKRPLNDAWWLAVPRKPRTQRVEVEPPLIPNGPIEKTKTSQEHCVRRAHEERNVKKQKKRKIKDTPRPARPQRRPRKTFLRPEPDHLPEGLKNWIEDQGGRDLCFIYQKHLDPSDTRRGNNRLAVPVSQVRSPAFMREDEKLRARERVRNNKIRGVEVKVVDQSLREYNLVWKEWEMESCSTYNLVSGWFQVVSDNNLKTDTNVQLWSFRLQSQLCFALVMVPEEEEEVVVDEVNTELKL